MVHRGNPAIWLDVTRLVSRAGRPVLTGVDRVEHAWLRHLLAEGSSQTRYLLRTTRGYLLLDHRGGRIILSCLEGSPLPKRGDWVSRLYGKGSDPRHRLESMLRPLAQDRALSRGLGRLIRRSGAVGFTYLNVAHANLSSETLRALSDAPDVHVAVLIHDLIPILHPDLVADDMPERFAERIERVRRAADLILCNSDATAQDLAAHWAHADHCPPMVVAPLGLDPRPRSDVARDPRHFVMLGTIEPRKNHALMLDVWEGLARVLPPDLMPQLHIIGPTGWRVEAVMNRLARHPLLGRSIHLHGPLPEAAVRDHLGRAVALLFPSLAEGYGYPPLEAALAGALPICSDLPVFRKTLGESAVYRKADDVYLWLETIRKHCLDIERLPILPVPDVPTWDEHHLRVTRALVGIA
jgi:glycosyltransferase involved in cell wall biosynthesis